MAVTTQQFGASAASLITQLQAGSLAAPSFTSQFVALVNSWGVSNPALAQSMATFVSNVNLSQSQFAAYYAGPATGGAAAVDGSGSGGGFYPLTDENGVTRYFQSPAAIAAIALPPNLMGSLTGQAAAGAAPGRLLELTTGMAGIVPNDPTKALSNTNALAALVATAISMRATKIVAEPAGDIYVGGGSFSSILSISGITWPFIVDLRGSRLIYDETGAVYPPDAIIESSLNADVTFLGASWTYKILPWCQGNVTAFSNTANTITFTPDPGFAPTKAFACCIDHADLNERAFVSTIGSPDSGDYALVSNTDGTWTISLGSGRTVDPGNAYNAVSVLNLVVGSKVVVRHSKYQTAGFASTDDAILRGDTTCGAITGLANKIIGSGDCELYCKHVPPPGGLLAGNADGVNVANIRGKLKLEYDSFGLGDDVLNIRGQVWYLTASTANSVTGAFESPSGQVVYNGWPFAPNVGDQAIFYNYSTGAEVTLTIQSISDQGAGPSPSRTLLITFTQALPSWFTTSGACQVFDFTQAPTLASINARVHGMIVGRGAVVQIPNVDLKINSTGTMYEGFVIGSLGYSGEIGQTVHNVIEGDIRNSAYFEGANPSTAGSSLAAARIAPILGGSVYIKRLNIHRSGFGGLYIANTPTMDLANVTMLDVGRLRTALDTAASASGNDLFIANSAVTIDGLRKLDGAGVIMVADTASTVQVNQTSIIGFGLQAGSHALTAPAAVSATTTALANTSSADRATLFNAMKADNLFANFVTT